MLIFGGVNGTHFGGIKQDKTMQIYDDFDNLALIFALFGLVI